MLFGVAELPKNSNNINILKNSTLWKYKEKLSLKHVDVMLM